MKNKRLEELRESVNDCCGDNAGKGFCETFGCGTVKDLIALVDRYRSVLERIAEDDIPWQHIPRFRSDEKSNWTKTFAKEELERE